MERTAEELRAERRARREERRARQRLQNVDRAAKMHQAKVAWEGAADCNQVQPPAVNIGCSGWYYWHWKGIFYPADLPGKDWFAFYKSQFKTVELNAPFYSWPTIGTVKTWNRQTGRSKFVYTIKVNELITHQKRMVGTKQLIRDFYHIADLLGPKMGCFLFQFPPSLKYSLSALKRITAQLDPSYRNVVEFRHRSWWSKGVYSALRDAGITFCSCSGPRLPDELVETSDEIYLRFHGTSRWYRHDYSDAELIMWAQRVREAKAKRVWAYFNNDRDGHAIRNARRFLRMLQSIV